MPNNDLEIIALVAKQVATLKQQVGDLARMPGPKGDTGVSVKGEIGKKGNTGEKGDTGEPGEKGDAGEKGDTGSQGDKGDTGDTGPAPQHEWRGTKLRFEKPDGTWGKLVDLKGDKGEQTQTKQVAPLFTTSAAGADGAQGIQGEVGPQGATGSTGPAGPWMPYYIAADETFTVPANQQGLSATEITIDGTLQVDGRLVEVL